MQRTLLCFRLDFVIGLIITDTTNENERSWHFVAFEALTTAVSAGVTFGIGYYIDWRGFIDLYWISLSLQIISMIMVWSFISTDSSTIDERTSLLSEHNEHEHASFHSQPFLCCICSSVQWQHRSRQQSSSLLLTLVAYVFYLLAYSTYASFLWYLLDRPFCWSSEDIGNYNAMSSIACAILSLLGMKLFSLVQASDAMVCTWSHLLFALSSLWIALSTHSWQLYVGLLISPFADYQNALTLPMISKWFNEHERNHVFILVTEINTIFTTVGNGFFNWFYANTISQHRNLTLFLATGFSVISMISNM
jgi:hypothetical protein